MVDRSTIGELLRHKRPSEVTVGDLMTRHPMTVSPAARLSEVRALMDREHIMHVPVVEDGTLLGLVSERNVSDALPSVLMVHDADAQQRALRATRVTRVWVESPPSVPSSASLDQAIEAMRKLKSSSLPVVDAGKLVGMLTAGDLISFLQTVLHAS